MTSTISHITTLKRITAATVAKLQAALDREFEKQICTVGKDRTGITLDIPADQAERTLYLKAFASGFLASRGA